MEARTEDKSFAPNPETKLHFLDYWRIIRIRKTVILAVFLLVALTTTVVTFILPETYSSMVRISIER
ncbi:MAG TPA: Wzz/FepE/Etk N-terminal domain-containing protein, partial [Candidatus Acidoferrum sp.]|nr:Wzz/FepE/Etk N-terminal domain-containing protein [Candidatus Acidoferrum sp.]